MLAEAGLARSVAAPVDEENIPKCEQSNCSVWCEVPVDL